MPIEKTVILFPLYFLSLEPALLIATKQWRLSHIQHIEMQ